jgi:uncharacterized protein YndB with AHSA1/START domain
MTVFDRTPAAVSGEREIVASRVFDAPRERVFRAFTDPDHVRRWWGPTGFTTPIVESDLRPGGIRRIVMRGPDGVEHPGIGEWREIVPPERLVFTNGFDQEEPVPFGEMVMTVTFDDVDGKTRVTVRTLFRSAADRATAAGFRALEGLDQTLDSLEGYLADT